MLDKLITRFWDVVLSLVALAVVINFLVTEPKLFFVTVLVIIGICVFTHAKI